MLYYVAAKDGYLTIIPVYVIFELAKERRFDMDNSETMLQNQETPKSKGETGKIVHIVAAIVIFIIATVLVIVTAAFSVDMHIIFTTAEGFEGLALIVLIPVSLIFALATVVLGIVGVVLSSTVWRYREGRDRVFGIVSTILNAVYILAGALFPIIVLLINAGN